MELNCSWFFELPNALKKKSLHYFQWVTTHISFYVMSGCMMKGPAVFVFFNNFISYFIVIKFILILQLLIEINGTSDKND